MASTVRPPEPNLRTPAQGSENDGAILFIGGVFPKHEEAQILARSKGNVEMAANTLQWNLITGLDVATGRPLSLLNAVFVRSFPRFYRDVWIRGRRWSHAEGAQDESVGFVNVFGIKHAWKTCALAWKARRWVASRRRGSRKVIILYAMHTPFIIAGALAKRLDRSVTLCLVVPDLPEHMNLGGTGGRAWARLKAMDRAVMNHFLRHVDCFVLLTKFMAEPLAVAERPWMVMEGAVDPAEGTLAPRAPSPESEKVVLYAGSLHKAYGIIELLEAFSLIRDPTYRLWICGAGDAEEDVRRVAARDRRVRYFGRVDRREVLRLQGTATVLVNPRGDTAEFTRYSFPSKILEYMLSGTPAIVRRLPGIPDEYFEFLFAVDGPSTADLGRKIVEVCEMPADERRRAGERARHFVVDQKSKAVQARRVLELVNMAGSGTP